MILSVEIAEKIAKSLLQIKAIKLEPKKPFKWASGWNSPIYCDNRITLSYPDLRAYITKQLSYGISKKYGKVDVIAGVATGAIAQGALIAKDLNLPFIYVRSNNKEHGRKNLIEGYIEKKQNIVVIEDLISSGKSSLFAVNTLREAGHNIKGMAAIFSYGFKNAKENFLKNKCDFFTLSNYECLIQEALKIKYISQNELSILKKWSENPSKWDL